MLQGCQYLRFLTKNSKKTQKTIRISTETFSKKNIQNKKIFQLLIYMMIHISSLWLQRQQTITGSDNICVYFHVNELWCVVGTFLCVSVPILIWLSADTCCDVNICMIFATLLKMYRYGHDIDHQCCCAYMVIICTNCTTYDC